MASPIDQRRYALRLQKKFYKTHEAFTILLNDSKKFWAEQPPMMPLVLSPERMGVMTNLHNHITTAQSCIGQMLMYQDLCKVEMAQSKAPDAVMRKQATVYNVNVVKEVHGYLESAIPYITEPHASWYKERLRFEESFLAMTKAFGIFLKQAAFLIPEMKRRSDFHEAVEGCEHLRAFLADTFGFFGEGFAAYDHDTVDWAGRGIAGDEDGVGGAGGGDGGKAEVREGEEAKPETRKSALYDSLGPI